MKKWALLLFTFPLFAAPPPVRLCRYSDIPMCVSTYSKGGEWSHLAQ